MNISLLFWCCIVFLLFRLWNENFWIVQFACFVCILFATHICNTWICNKCENFANSREICPSVRLSVNFSHFHLLLRNHWADFNLWHKASLINVIRVCSNEVRRPFPKEDLLQNHWAKITKLGTKHPWVTGIDVCSYKGSRPVSKGR